MLTWIEHWFAKGSSWIARKALAWIHVALHAIAGVLTTIIGRIRNAWQGFRHEIWTIFSDISFGFQLTYHALWWLYQKGIPSAYHYALRLATYIEHLAVRLYRQSEYDILAAYKRAAAYVHAQISWFDHHIVAPIRRDVYSAWQWIRKDGARAIYLLTHPSDLASVVLGGLGTAIMRAGDPILSVTGHAIFALVVKNIARYPHIIEDIISSIL